MLTNDPLPGPLLFAKLLSLPTLFPLMSAPPIERCWAAPLMSVHGAEINAEMSPVSCRGLAAWPAEAACLPACLPAFRRAIGVLQS